MYRLRGLVEYCTLPKFGSPEEELSFHRWNDRKKLKQRKYFLLLAIVTYTLFGALDPLTGGTAADEMLAIRSLTCLFLTVIWVGFLRAHDFERRELCVFLFGFTTMASLLWIILIADQPAANYYPFSFGVVMIFGTTLIVPRFSTVAALAIGCFIAYWAAVPWAKTSIDAMLVNAFLMSVTTCSIVVGAFAREKLEREAAITNLKLARTRSEAIEMRDAALRANHAKSHFLANVSHELRTPMNAILGFSEVMRDGIFGPVTPSRYAEYVDNIHFSGSLLLANINDLLDFSRIELNKLGWSEKPFQVGEVIGIAIATCEAGFEDATIRFTDRTGRRHARMMGDEGRLSQAIINIVGNAIKFSPPGVPVEVSFEPHEKGGAVLHVRDRGCGIPPSDLERIREPFGQVNADSYSAQKGGLGLGLAITGEIVNRLQGELLIESEPGVGTCVSILLPAARFMQAEAAAA